MDEGVSGRQRSGLDQHIGAILNHLPMGVIIAEAPSGRMITYNPAAEALFGYPPPLAEGSEEYSELYTGFHPDGRPYAPEEWPLARAVRHGEEVNGEEIELVRPDGARVVFRISAAPIRDADGQIVAAVCGMHDVTEEKRRGEMRRFLGEVSDALATSLDYEETVQSIAHLACRALADYAAVYVQEEDGAIRGLGYAAMQPGDEDAIRYLMRGVPRDAGEEHPIVAAMRAGEPRIVNGLTDEGMAAMAGDPGRLELIRRLELGCLLIMPLSAGGRTLGVIALARQAGACAFHDGDVALARELATRAAYAVDNARLYRVSRRTARMHEETIGIVSHDLRNALNSALMNTDLVMEGMSGLPGWAEGRRQLAAVRRSLTHMQRLAQDLLEMDRIDRGRLSIHPEPLSPASLVEELHGWLGPLARGAGLEWEVDIPSDMPPILADHARLIQVFSNLVGNAVDATPRGGRISIRAECTATEVCFHVRDTGSGIDGESLPRVFDRFFQAADRGRTGSGLGLTISRGLVEAHGGRMWAASRLGEGSTFSFALPLHR